LTIIGVLLLGPLYYYLWDASGLELLFLYQTCEIPDKTP